MHRKWQVILSKTRKKEVLRSCTAGGAHAGSYHLQEAAATIDFMLINKEQNRNFGLSQAQFDALTEQLRCGDESIFESIFLAHFNKCLLFVKRKYNASHEAAYDAAMWSLLKMRELLLHNKVHYGNLEAYMTQIATSHYLKQQMRNKEISTDVFFDGPEEAPDEVQEMTPVLEKAWNLLGQKCRTLLQGFYYDKIELKQLTIQLNDTSEANTRKKKERCLKELRHLFFEQL